MLSKIQTQLERLDRLRIRMDILTLGTQRMKEELKDNPRRHRGYTGMVALELGRRCTGIELNPEYIQLAEQRTNVTPGLCLH